MEQDGVVLARRKSGGGAVYQDLGNSCFTFLTSRKDYDIPRNTSIIVNALKHFNIHAEPTGRNDITVGGRKVSGSAFKLTHDRAFHHGTLLMNVDLNALERYLNPNKEKLKSKGVASVKARVVNMKELNNDICHETVVPQLVDSFFKTYDSSCEIEYLDAKQLAQISSLNKYYEEYKDWDWRFGKTPDFSHSLERRFDWGIMDVNFEASGGKITDVKVFSDSLYPQMIEEVQMSLKGASYDKQGVSGAIERAKQKLTGTGTEAQLDEFKEWLVKNI
jgi:lipoate-protein ligase A